jgi:hypothetical protein
MEAVHFTRRLGRIVQDAAVVAVTIEVEKAPGGTAEVDIR